MSEAKLPESNELHVGDCTTPEDTLFPAPSAPEDGAADDPLDEQPSKTTYLAFLPVEFT